MNHLSPETRCRSCGGGLTRGPLAGLCPTCLWTTALEAGPAPADSDPLGTPRLANAGSAWRLGQYEVLAEIARGGSGIVFRARDLALGREVALKLLREGPLASREDTRRLFLEARAAARLRHPHIVPIFEVGGADADRPFLAMAFLPGGTLADRLRRGAVSPPEAARWLAAVARAVHHAHQHGILHRDLKPGNILFDASGEPFVADFGLACLLDEDHTLTQGGAILGTPAYLSPEQAAGRSGAISVASDIHALGAILYEMLTGRPPFAGADIPALLRQIAEASPRLPRQIEAAIPRDLETLCLKCLEKDPARRYATAQDLADDLERFLGHEPILARPITTTERAWRWCRRKPALATSAFLLLLLLLVLGIGGPLAALRINDARRTAVAKELEARRTQYASEMRLAHQAQGEGDLPGVRRLLQRHARRELGQPDLRGWEWRYLWRESKGSPRTVLTRHTNAVYSVGLLPEGGGAYSAGQDGVVKLYDWPTRRVVGELAHGEPVSISATSPDGRWLLSLTENPNASQGKRPVVLWDLPNRREQAILFKNTWPRESTLAISPDSKVFAFVDQIDPEELLVCELPSGSEIARFPARTDNTTPQGIAFTPDGGTLIFSADVEGTLVLIDTRQWREVGRLKGHRRNVNSLAVSPDGRWLASVSEDRSLRLWDLATRQLIAARETFRPSYSVAFSPDSTRIATPTGSGISIFSVPQLKSLSGLGAPSSAAECVVYLSDTELLSGAGDGEVAIFPLDAGTQAQISVTFAHGVTVNAGGTGAATFLSPDHSAVLGVFTNRTFTVWKLPGFESTGELPLPVTNFSCATISARGETAAFADSVGNVVLWRAADHRVSVLGRVGSGMHSRMRFSSDGRQLAIGDFGRYYVWDVPSRQQTHAFATGDGWACVSLDFSPQGQSLAAGQFNGMVYHWPLDASQPQQVLRGHSQRVKDLTFADHGRTLITPSEEVRFWDLRSGVQSRQLTDLPGTACRVALSPDETRLAIGYEHGDISILNSATGEEVMRLKAFDWDVRCLGFSADGNDLVAVSREQIRIWRAAPLTEIAAGESSLPLTP